MGERIDNQEEEFAEMRKALDQRTTAIGDGVKVEDKYIRELLRYGRAQLHCVSSFMGGLAAQEACKLMMNQYVPLNHTLVYDGIHGKVSVFQV